MLHLQRELQLPISDISFSKNRIFVEVSWEDHDQVQKDLHTIFQNEMALFKNTMEDIQSASDYARLLKQAEFLKYLKTRPIYAQVQQEFVRYEQLNNTK